MKEEKPMAKDRVEMLSPDATRAMVEKLGMPEAIGTLNIFRTLLHRPKTAVAISNLLLSLLLEAELDHRLRELVIMRIGWVTGSVYEWTQHWPLAQDMFGCKADELLAVRDWRAAGLFSELDRDVLGATDELLETGTLSDESWSRCESALGRDASIDLVAAVGTWLMISKVARGLRIPLEEGVAAWPPDGRAAPADGGRP